MKVFTKTGKIKDFDKKILAKSIEAAVKKAGYEEVDVKKIAEKVEKKLVIGYFTKDIFDVVMKTLREQKLGKATAFYKEKHAK